ncbi:hypothetical protein HYW94_00725 [Candidatus Uhrbacteria bacterium]|nr:hypothetical protein [Candidatus Uhrbacteria bacterium]
MAVEIGKEYQKLSHKESERKVEEFTTRILPGILKRTGRSGHFRHMKTQELIAPSQMSDNIEEDMKQYRTFTLQLHTLLTQNEKGKVREADREKIRDMFHTYGKGREQGKVHYFIEYLKNKSAQIIAALELMLDGYIPQERLSQEIRKVLSELSGKEITLKKKSAVK